MLSNAMIFIFISAAVLLANVASTLILGMVMPKPTQVAKFAKGDIANILDELNLLIKLEFIAVVEAPNTIRQIDYISDIEKIQKEVIKNVVDSLSTKFFLMANNAGLKRSYIISYITRNTLYEIWKYIREHNFTPKKG